MLQAKDAYKIYRESQIADPKVIKEMHKHVIKYMKKKIISAAKSGRTEVTLVPFDVFDYYHVLDQKKLITETIINVAKETGYNIISYDPIILSFGDEVL